MGEPTWAQLPSKWILEGELTDFRWQTHKGNATAALLILIALCLLQNLAKLPSKRKDAPVVPGGREVRASYDALMAMTNVSRAKVSAGLKLLKHYEVIEATATRGVYRLTDVSTPGSWCKLPQSFLLGRVEIISFAKHLRLRSPSELDALKIYLLMLALRNRKTEDAWVGYDKIITLTGVDRNRVATAKSHLYAWGLMAERVVDVDPMGRNTGKPVTLYRIIGLSRLADAVAEAAP